ncbi:MAG: hypothetical protein LBJ96_03575 [Holosporaceae bacterium]|nr:hypothetical protein [Holosporaceae bacterium]
MKKKICFLLCAVFGATEAMQIPKEYLKFAQEVNGATGAPIFNPLGRRFEFVIPIKVMQKVIFPLFSSSAETPFRECETLVREIDHAVVFFDKKSAKEFSETAQTIHRYASLLEKDLNFSVFSTLDSKVVALGRQILEMTYSPEFEGEGLERIIKRAESLSEKVRLVSGILSGDIFSKLIALTDCRGNRNLCLYFCLSDVPISKWASLYMPANESIRLVQDVLSVFGKETSEELKIDIDSFLKRKSMPSKYEIYQALEEEDTSVETQRACSAPIKEWFGSFSGENQSFNFSQLMILRSFIERLHARRISESGCELEKIFSVKRIEDILPEAIDLLHIYFNLKNPKSYTSMQKDVYNKFKEFQNEIEKEKFLIKYLGLFRALKKLMSFSTLSQEIGSRLFIPDRTNLDKDDVLKIMFGLAVTLEANHEAHWHFSRTGVFWRFYFTPGRKFIRIPADNHSFEEANKKRQLLKHVTIEGSEGIQSIELAERLKSLEKSKGGGKLRLDLLASGRIRLLELKIKEKISLFKSLINEWEVRTRACGEYSGQYNLINGVIEPSVHIMNVKAQLLRTRILNS